MSTPALESELISSDEDGDVITDANISGLKSK
jgi:hypothetical protein